MVPHWLSSHRSDFSGAATIAECLLILSRASTWRDVVSRSVLSPLSTKVEVSTAYPQVTFALSQASTGDGSLFHICADGSGRLSQGRGMLKRCGLYCSSHSYTERAVWCRFALETPTSLLLSLSSPQSRKTVGQCSAVIAESLRW